MEIPYLAGLLDGEGTVTLTCLNSGKRRSPVVSVANTRLELLEPFVAEFGGHISNKRPRKANHTKSYAWKVVGDSAIDCLKRLLPHMRHPEKVRRAKLITRRYKAVTPRNGRYSLEAKDAKNKFEHDFFHPSTA